VGWPDQSRRRSSFTVELSRNLCFHLGFPPDFTSQRNRLSPDASINGFSTCAARRSEAIKAS
jgi:hypothetical protein